MSTLDQERLSVMVNEMAFTIAADVLAGIQNNRPAGHLLIAAYRMGLKSDRTDGVMMAYRFLRDEHHRLLRGARPVASKRAATTPKKRRSKQREDSR